MCFQFFTLKCEHILDDDDFVQVATYTYLFMYYDEITNLIIHPTMSYVRIMGTPDVRFRYLRNFQKGVRYILLPVHGILKIHFCSMLYLFLEYTRVNRSDGNTIRVVFCFIEKRKTVKI